MEDGAAMQSSPAVAAEGCERLIAESRDLKTSLAYLLTTSLPYFAAPVHLF
jgi:hypothetical protein